MDETLALLRYHDPEAGVRFGCRMGTAVYDLTGDYGTLMDWLAGSVGKRTQAVEALRVICADRVPVVVFEDLLQPPSSAVRYLLAPVDRQEVWAAGVTYQRSREAREAESDLDADVYARVYQAARPEIFFKAFGERVVGPYGPIGIRADAAWSVPEPELGVVFNSSLEVVGYTVGNDVSSRDIEGANPLYLPQAKIYKQSCALGPVIIPAAQPGSGWPACGISLQIQRDGQVIFSGETHTDQIRRSLEDLAGYLGRSNAFPNGLVLLTGTGIVPPDEVHLQAGDRVVIAIEGIGELVNPVEVV